MFFYGIRYSSKYSSRDNSLFYCSLAISIALVSLLDIVPNVLLEYVPITLCTYGTFFGVQRYINFFKCLLLVPDIGQTALNEDSVKMPSFKFLLRCPRYQIVIVTLRNLFKVELDDVLLCRKLETAAWTDLAGSRNTGTTTIVVVHINLVRWTVFHGLKTTST